MHHYLQNELLAKQTRALRPYAGTTEEADPITGARPLRAWKKGEPFGSTRPVSIRRPPYLGNRDAGRQRSRLRQFLGCIGGRDRTGSGQDAATRVSALVSSGREIHRSHALLGVVRT